MGFTEGGVHKTADFWCWWGWVVWVGRFLQFYVRGCKLRKVDLPGWVRVDLLGWVWVDLLGWARQYGRSESGKALRF